MPMIEEMESSGKWLFRWRSYLPLVMLIIIFGSFGYFRYPYNNQLVDELWEVVCLAVGLTGVVIRGLVAGCAPRGTSGRNTRRQVAESLNTTGMYSIVRNPLYLGNFFMGLSISLFLRVWWVPLIYMLSFMLYYERIVFAEEMFLRNKFGREYVSWASNTPAFLPKFSNWLSPSLPFSWRVFVRREYQSIFGLIIAVFFLEQATDLYLEFPWHVDIMWKWIIGFSITVYVTVLFIHKKTRLLNVEGR